MPMDDIELDRIGQSSTLVLSLRSLSAQGGMGSGEPLEAGVPHQLSPETAFGGDGKCD